MLDLHAIFKARNIVSQYATRTPLVPALSLCSKDREVRLKLESTQPIGAFKLRGAINAVSQLTDEQRAHGVVCASTGNHGRALAYAARALGSQATVCMSKLVPQNKIDAIVSLEAQVHIHGESQDEAQQWVDQLVAEEGMTEIPPFDHSDVLAGQGTIGLEIIEDWVDVDTVVVGLSGGGLLSGIALAVKSINPNIRIVGVSPERGAAMAASIKAGKPVEVTEQATLADSLGGGIGLQNRYTFSHVCHLMDDLVLLKEIHIARAMRHLFFEEQLVTEGAAAVGAALLLEADAQQQLKKPLGKRIALIISGCNVDMQQFSMLINQTHPVFNTDG